MFSFYHADKDCPNEVSRAIGFIFDLPATLLGLTREQADYLIDKAKCVRDKCIISLFADSGLRLNELVDINTRNIDWQNRLTKVRCKGKNEGLAVFV